MDKPKKKREPYIYSENNKSIMPISFHYSTQREPHLEKHHILGGANRSKSEQYGLFIFINNEQHQRYHTDKEAILHLKREGQRAFEENYPELSFLQIFGRSYL